VRSKRLGLIKPPLRGQGHVPKSLDWDGPVTEVLSLLYLRFAMLPPSAYLAEVADGTVYGV